MPAGHSEPCCVCTFRNAIRKHFYLIMCVGQTLHLIAERQIAPRLNCTFLNQNKKQDMSVFSEHISSRSVSSSVVPSSQSVTESSYDTPSTSFSASLSPFDLDRFHTSSTEFSAVAAGKVCLATHGWQEQQYIKGS